MEMPPARQPAENHMLLLGRKSAMERVAGPVAAPERGRLPRTRGSRTSEALLDRPSIHNSRGCGSDFSLGEHGSLPFGFGLISNASLHGGLVVGPKPVATAQLPLLRQRLLRLLPSGDGGQSRPAQRTAARTLVARAHIAIVSTTAAWKSAVPAPHAVGTVRTFSDRIDLR
jgi:hypothetical protein